jgi:DNA replication protein DnaC
MSDNIITRFLTPDRHIPKEDTCLKCGIPIRNEGSKFYDRFFCDGCGQAEREEQDLRRARVPQRYRQAEMSDFDGTNEMTILTIWDWINGSAHGVYLTGDDKDRNAKLACAVARELVRKGADVIYASLPEAVIESKRAISNGRDNYQVCVDICNHEFIILDELSSIDATPYCLGMVLFMMSRIQRDMKQVMIQSSVDIRLLSERFKKYPAGTNLVNLIVSLCEPVVLVGRPVLQPRRA